MVGRRRRKRPTKKELNDVKTHIIEIIDLAIVELKGIKQDVRRGENLGYGYKRLWDIILELKEARKYIGKYDRLLEKIRT